MPIGLHLSFTIGTNLYVRLKNQKPRSAMEGDTHNQSMGSRGSFSNRITAISCIRTLVVVDLIFHGARIIFSAFVLYASKDAVLEEPLRVFLTGYIFLCAAKGVAFFSKNRAFFHINRLPEYEENNNGIGVFSNLVEGCSLFWYILGYHWLQQCDTCAKMYPLLYYTIVAWLVLGFVSYILPLVAIVLLLLIVSYVRPKLKTIVFGQESDIRDGNSRCVICYENYIPGNLIKFLPCDHHFHSECVDEWLNIRDTCPLCKKSTSVLYDLIETTDSPV